MHSGVMWCLFLFVLAVGNDPVRASGATRGLSADDKLPIVLKASKLLLGSCPKRPAPTMNVRLQTLKTKSGAIFRRNAVTDDVFACLAAGGSQPLVAGNIQECAERAVAVGRKMFRWDGGVCTGYTKGIPATIARCAGAGSVVLYSVDVEAESPVVTNVVVTLPRFGTVSVTWNLDDTCWLATADQFVTYSSGTTVISSNTVSGTATTDSLTVTSPCSNLVVSVTPRDTAGNNLASPTSSSPVTQHPACDSGFVDVCSGCLANSSNLLTKAAAATACSNMNSNANLMTVSSEAEFATFQTYMIDNFGTLVADSYWVDLTLSGTVWTWRGGYVQMTTYWAVGYPSGSSACAIIRSTKMYLLVSKACSYTYKSICYY